MSRKASEYTDDEIEKAIALLSIGDRHDENRLHQHPDCVRIAIAWLSAQKTVKGRQRNVSQTKHKIEAWAGRYVPWYDVQVAAHMIGLAGEYPDFNLASRTVFPHTSRLDGIHEAFAHRHYMEKLFLSGLSSWYNTPERQFETTNLGEAIKQHVAHADRCGVVQ